MTLKHFLLAGFTAFALFANAQFVVTANNNAAQILQNLQGQGVTLSNPVLLCHNCGIGTFTGGNATNLGITSGVVMSTGAVAVPCGTATVGVAAPPGGPYASFIAGGPSDPLVNLISPSSNNSFDRCRLEFDIVPTGDTVSFDYVFGSEEYTSYTCSNFNDAFGFFISGNIPGGGTYTNQNVALVPGTNLPVLINTINDGIPDGLATPCYTNNTQYYVNNLVGSSIVFDGMTVVLTAKFATIPCQSYHIILVIGDVGDASLDSGVFLEAKSFASTNVTISSSTTAGASFTNAVEGCVNGQFRFKINPALPTNYTINYTVAGTATNGVDYAPISNSVVVPAGDTIATIPINVVNDGINEGLETVKLYLINPCTNLPYDSAVITIQDSILADATASDYFICRGESTTLTGIGGVTYNWSPASFLANPNSQITVATPDSTITYLLTATVQGCVGRDTLTIHVSDPNFTVDAGPNVTVCANELVQFAPVVTQGAQPYTYSWTPTTYITTGTANTQAPTAYPQQSITYTLTVNSANGCTLTDTFRVTVAGVGPPIKATVNPTTICPGQQVQLDYISQPLNCGVNYTGCFGTDKIDSLCAGCLTQTGSATANVSLYGNYVRSRRVQMLYRANELLPLFGSGGTIKELAWRVGTYNSNATLENFTISIKCVSPSQTTLTNWETGMKTVFGPKNYTPLTGPVWNFHQLDSLYDWDGVSNLVVEVCFFNPTTFGSLNNMMQYSTVANSVLFSTGATNQCGAGVATSSSQRPKLRMRLCQANYTTMTTAWTPASGPNTVSNPSIKAPTANPQTTQTYQVTVSQNGCNGSANVTVNIDTSVKVNAGPDQSFCVGQNITLNGVTSGSPLPGNTFTFQWRTLPNNALVGGTQSITVNPAVTTTYVVSLTGGPCVVTDTVTLNIGSLGITHQITPITCNGAANGKIKVTSTGNAPYTYNWSANALTGNVDSAINLGPGTYYVTITDALNCVGRDTITLTEPTTIAFTSNVVNVSCNGLSDGEIVLTASGGTGTLSYAWSNSLPNASNVTGLSANTYIVTVSDANNCTSTGSFTVTEPAVLAITNVTSKNVRCFNGNDGNIGITAGGGTLPYTYIWSHNASLNSPSSTALSANTYTVTVRDLNLCTATASITITQPAAGISFGAPIITDVSCFGGNNGTASMNPTGGSAPYTYVWTPSNQTTQTATSLIAQQYSVLVTDDSLCTATTTITVNQPAQIQLSGAVTNVSCNGGSNGAIDLTVTNGVAPFTFAWNNGAGTIEDPQNLAANTYTVVVTDFTNCTQTATYVVTQPTPLILNTPTITNVSCFGGNNGSITANPAGGTTPYSYTWTPSGTTQTINSLTANSYTVIVTDAQSCTVTNTYNVTEPSAPLTWSAPTITNILCNGNNTGSITVSLSGGTPNYNYLWSHNSQLNNATASSIVANTYTVTATDANQCSITAQHTVTQPPALVFGNTNVTDVTCYGASTGSIQVNVSGGTGGYSYTWNGTPGANPYTGIAAGNYVVVVTDANNCNASTTVVVNQPAVFALNPITKDASCYNSPTASIDANPTGGLTPYEFLWSPGNYTTQVASMIYAGSYVVAATDANGCTVSASASVNEPTELTFTLNATQVKCVGDKNGTITVNATGATPPYSYSATQDFTNFVFATNNIIQDLAAGWYNVVVADFNGCTKVDSVEVPNAVEDVYVVTADSTSCFGPEYNDGVIHITGITNQNMPYQYSVDGGPLQYSNDFYYQSAGQHEVTGVNNFGCVTNLTIVVPQPVNAFAEVYPGDTVLQLGETIQLGSGFGPYPLSDIKSYLWVPSTGLSCDDCPNPVATPYGRITEYFLTITYNKNCKANASMTIIVENNLPVFIPNAFSPNGDGNNDVFEIYGQGIKVVDLTIFNRWGELVYQSNSQYAGWDGTYKGEMQQPSVFTYYANITFLDNKKIERKGTVTILR